MHYDKYTILNWWLRNTGPYAWVQYVPGERILPNRPNEGSVKGRKEKKRMRLRRAFILVILYTILISVLLGSWVFFISVTIECFFLTTGHTTLNMFIKQTNISWL